MPDFLVGDPVQLLNSAKKAVIRMTAGPQPAISLGDNDSLAGRIVLNAANANLFLRAKKQPGEPPLAPGETTFMVDGDVADLMLGGGPANGDLLICPAGTTQSVGVATFHYSASSKLLLLKGANNQPSVRIDGGLANFWIGGNGMDGDVVIHPSSVSNDAPTDMSSIHLTGDGSTISIRFGGQETIRIDGKKGDIILANADGAEEFEVESDNAEAGSVLVIEDETRLRLADRPYDRRVAGIVSGAGGIRPGIVLGRGRDGLRVPLALFGKVNCRVDASYGPVVAGDLLTTSETPGHAMRAEPGNRALGAVIGKALCAFDAGRGLLPVLVALQ